MLIFGCFAETNNSKNTDANMAEAEAFIDAFYSFDQDSLKSLLTKTDKSAESILFYQGWAEQDHPDIDLPVLGY